MDDSVNNHLATNIAHSKLQTIKKGQYTCKWKIIWRAVTVVRRECEDLLTGMLDTPF